ncbi:DUF3761 domain-containing protein [Mycobacterium kansasii]|uniref:DUF3761 domain-containing protein n=1 Tax=Mycobacterium kansasii TaxID=1768 RepID=UPI0009B9143A|nr:DUF3761 domain-containing protein [Mycobacterium kansasii]MXO37348.1 DUF3761 domain-containing protein [Mycobacterium kansasii]ORB99986.1 hypothetical protein B1T46_07165 [Mycobacterium kansasii]POX71235.1 DUF3761 domain-containing protein [Mycobacterium kansasii]POX79177.1 DUF3761 domain-containing protein [Mycobacterium kansasii]POX84801.1 DUF3761 domain-containing protein [Mycobacterium kansasii]
MFRSLAVVIAVVAGTAGAGLVTHASHASTLSAAGMCPPGSYQNSSGACVPRPDSSNDDVTAICRDGSHSHSQHRNGTCSGHGGVGQWCPCSFSSGHWDPAAGPRRYTVIAHADADRRGGSHHLWLHGPGGATG